MSVCQVVHQFPPSSRAADCTMPTGFKPYIGRVPWEACERIFGLSSYRHRDRDLYPEEENILTVAKRILQNLYPFCYDHEESRTPGIEFARVEPGDFVFRSATAAGSGTATPLSLCGLILRPHHQASSTGPATSRLVGMCIDYFPYMENPEIIEVVLV